MSNQNRGKEFEGQVRASLESVPSTAVLRLIDPQNGFAGVRNICDFVAYHFPTMYLLECKSCYGNTLPFTNITDGQWAGLREMDKIDGVVAGYLIWFIDHDKTVFVPAREMVKHKESGEKSFNINKPGECRFYEISGTKRRILFDYNFMDFFINIERFLGYE